VEDDVDVWRYAILELHARNDDDDTCHCVISIVDFTSISKGVQTLIQVDQCED